MKNVDDLAFSSVFRLIRYALTVVLPLHDFPLERTTLMAPREKSFAFTFVAWIDGRPKRSEPTKVPRQAPSSKLYEKASDAFGLAEDCFKLAVAQGKGTKEIIAEKRTIRWVCCERNACIS